MNTDPFEPPDDTWPGDEVPAVEATTDHPGGPLQDPGAMPGKRLNPGSISGAGNNAGTKPVTPLRPGRDSAEAPSDGGASFCDSFCAGCVRCLNGHG